MRLDRRTFLGSFAATVLPLRASGAAVSKVDPADAKGGDVTVLEARPGKTTLDPTWQTAVWAYNGHVPGPLLRIKKGEELRVRLVNKLDQPTSLCWHGVRNINAMDGVAGLTQEPVKPDETFEYRFTPPDAGLFWYHPHVWPVSPEQIGRGLYGVLIVDETEPPPVDEDLLVVLNDWSLDAKGQIKGDFLDAEQALHNGRIGKLVTVNAKPVPLAVKARPGSRLRLRFLNACSARVAIISFSDLEATVIAIDGQPSEIFRPARDMIPLGPGARFELVVDLPPTRGASQVTLRSEGEPDQPLMTLRSSGEPRPAPPAVEKLPENPALPARIPLEKAMKRQIVIAGGAEPPPPQQRNKKGKKSAKGALKESKSVQEDPPRANPVPRLWTIDGVSSDGFSGKPLFKVKPGTAVSLALANKSGFVQQMHVHGHAVRLLHDLDDGWDPYWRDSVLLGPGKTKHIAFIADNPGKWAIESLILDRQVTGLAAWFEVG